MDLPLEGGGMKFYESKEGDGIKICVLYCTQHLGYVKTCPPGNICILYSQIAFSGT